MDLIENLSSYINQNNMFVIKALCTTIEERNVKTIDDLENLERVCFTRNGKLLNEDEQIELMKTIIKPFISYLDEDEYYDRLSYIQKNREIIFTSSDNFEIKKSMILFLGATDCMLHFYKTAYDYIIKGIL